jgi:hypothetical protein
MHDSKGTRELNQCQAETQQKHNNRDLAVRAAVFMSVRLKVTTFQLGRKIRNVAVLHRGEPRGWPVQRRTTLLMEASVVTTTNTVARRDSAQKKAS